MYSGNKYMYNYSEERNFAIKLVNNRNRVRMNRQDIEKQKSNCLCSLFQECPEKSKVKGRY